MNLDYEKLGEVVYDKAEIHFTNYVCEYVKNGKEVAQEVIAASGLLEEVERLKGELKIASEIETKIGEMVGDRGQHRDLVEAVEIHLHKLNAELESHAWEISPAMAQAKIDELNKEVERLRARCGFCDGQQCVDSGGFDPQGNPIMIPCHWCHRFQIGEKWLKDSSLEAWFPYDAKELERLRATVKRVGDVCTKLSDSGPKLYMRHHCLNDLRQALKGAQ